MPVISCQLIPVPVCRRHRLGLVHQSHRIELKIPGQSIRDPGDRRALNRRNEAEDRKVLASIAILAANRGRRIAPAQRVRPPSPRPPHSRH